MNNFETRAHQLITQMRSNIRKLTPKGGQVFLETEIGGEKNIDITEQWKGLSNPETNHQALAQTDLKTKIKKDFRDLCDLLKKHLPISFSVRLTQKMFFVRSQTQDLIRAHLRDETTLKSQLQTFSRLHSKNQAYALYLINTHPNSTKTFDYNCLFQAVDFQHAVEQMRASCGPNETVYSAAKLTPVKAQNTSSVSYDTPSLEKALKLVCSQMNQWTLPPNFNATCSWTLLEGFSVQNNQNLSIDTITTREDKQRAAQLWRDIVDSFDVLAQIASQHPGLTENQLETTVDKGDLNVHIVTVEDKIPLDVFLDTLPNFQPKGPFQRYGVQQSEDGDLHYTYGRNRQEAILLYHLNQPTTGSEGALFYDIEPIPYPIIFTTPS